jgi:putative Ca2+/H+ antiporter (TMEM165/GDT1 family)
MDWKLFTATFGTIFLAELGDKTQFAAIAASAQSKTVTEILLAVVLALALAGALGVLAGKTLAQFISPEIMRWISRPTRWLATLTTPTAPTASIGRVRASSPL